MLRTLEGNYAKSFDHEEILIMKSTVLFVQTSLFGVDSDNEVTIGAERGLEHKNATET